MILTDHNTLRSKIHALHLGTSISTLGVAPWATVFVHRDGGYCVQYSNVSRASTKRVQRAQNVILAQGEAEHPAEPRVQGERQ